MIQLADLDYVKSLQADMRTTLDTDSGKRVMTFLEQLCGWYDFAEKDTNSILISTGKRQVLATIKTLLELPPDAIVAITKEQYDG